MKHVLGNIEILGELRARWCFPGRSKDAVPPGPCVRASGSACFQLLFAGDSACIPARVGAASNTLVKEMLGPVRFCSQLLSVRRESEGPPFCLS